MAFDDTQLAALRTAINAGISAPITTAAQTRNDTELARLLHTHAPNDPRVRALAAAAEPELRRQNLPAEAAEAARLAAP